MRLKYVIAEQNHKEWGGRENYSVLCVVTLFLEFFWDSQEVYVQFIQEIFFFIGVSYIAYYSCVKGVLCVEKTSRWKVHQY